MSALHGSHQSADKKPAADPCDALTWANLIERWRTTRSVRLGLNPLAECGRFALISLHVRSDRVAAKALVRSLVPLSPAPVPTV